VGWNLSLGSIQFDLFEEEDDHGSSVCADLGHENV